MIEQNPEQPGEVSLDLSTGKLLILSVVSANVYVFISLLIVRYWHKGNFYDLFIGGAEFWTQTAFGAGTGIAASLVIYLCIQIKPVADILSDFMIFEALSNAKFTFFDRTQLSFFAGAGEEVLFRGAIQPLLGNTLTSIIFIGIHGYFKFKSPAHIFFGVMMFALSFMLGFLADHIGLVAAMTAHALYDLVMLMALQRKS